MGPTPLRRVHLMFQENVDHSIRAAGCDQGTAAASKGAKPVGVRSSMGV